MTITEVYQFIKNPMLTDRSAMGRVVSAIEYLVWMEEPDSRRDQWLKSAIEYHKIIAQKCNIVLGEGGDYCRFHQDLVCFTQVNKLGL